MTTVVAACTEKQKAHAVFEGWGRPPFDFEGNLREYIFSFEVDPVRRSVIQPNTVTK